MVPWMTRLRAREGAVAVKRATALGLVAALELPSLYHLAIEPLLLLEPRLDVDVRALAEVATGVHVGC